MQLAEYIKNRNSNNLFNIVYDYYRNEGGNLDPNSFHSRFNLFQKMSNADVVKNLLNYLDGVHEVTVLYDKEGKEIKVY